MAFKDYNDELEIQALPSSRSTYAGIIQESLFFQEFLVRELHYSSYFWP